MDIGPTFGREAYVKVREHALAALRLVPDLGVGHEKLGIVAARLDYDWAGAEREFQRAISLDPENDQIHQNYAFLVLLPTGQFPRALAEFKKAFELSPNRADLLGGQAHVHYSSGDHPASLRIWNDLVKLAPWNPSFRTSRARVLTALERYDEAISDYNRALSKQPATNIFGRGGLAYAYARAGRKDAAREVLDELLRHADEPRITDALALAYTGLGEPANALDWLEEGYRRRDPWMMTIKVEPRYAALRGERRFHELLKKMRLE